LTISNSAAPGSFELPRDGLAEKDTLDMYYSARTSSSERPLELWACYGLVGSAILYGVCRFWNLDVPTGVLLTPPFVCLSLLLSRAAVRMEESIRKRAWATLSVVCLQAFFCLFFEAAMVHMGLEWLNARESFAPDWALWPASGALSLFNVGSVYAFVRDIPEGKPKQKKPSPPQTSADVILFGATPQERKTLEAVKDKLKAAGAM
jgi:hypothetical protein